MSTHFDESFATALSYERVISCLPITIRRRARFGECDPAGWVYTPVFSEYAMSAYSLTMEVLLKEPIGAAQQRLNFGSPIKALSLEFQRPIKPDQQFDMISHVGEIRRTTFDLLITGKNVGADQYVLFIANLTPIFVSAAATESSPIPSLIRDRLERYKIQTDEIAVKQS